MRSDKKKLEVQDPIVKKSMFELIKCLLDCLVALHYWKGSVSAKKAGVIGGVTSLIAIAQSFQLL
jgi:hypothetical protein